jgi:hypothetical protein
MIEVSGSVSLTNGSGSGRPKTFRSGSATLTVTFVRTQEFIFFSLIPESDLDPNFFIKDSKKFIKKHIFYKLPSPGTYFTSYVFSMAKKLPAGSVII